MTSEKTIKGALKEGKLLIGRNSVIRALKTGTIESVFYASNCPADFRRELEYSAGVSKVQVQKYGENSARLGQLCGKPFGIIMLGIKK